MALGDNTTAPERGSMARGRMPYFIQNEVDMAVAASDKGSALAAADVIPALTVGANTMVLTAGWEVTEAHAGTSTNTAFDLGITGGDTDAFVDGFDFDGAAVGAYSAVAAGGAQIVGSASDTIDILIQAMTGTTTGGKLRVWAWCMDLDDVGDLTADEVDRDELA